MHNTVLSHFWTFKRITINHMVLYTRIHSYRSSFCYWESFFFFFYHKWAWWSSKSIDQDYLNNFTWNLGLEGMRNVASSSNSHEQTHSNRLCYYQNFRCCITEWFLFKIFQKSPKTYVQWWSEPNKSHRISIQYWFSDSSG